MEGCDVDAFAGNIKEVLLSTAVTTIKNVREAEEEEITLSLIIS